MKKLSLLVSTFLCIQLVGQSANEHSSKYSQGKGYAKMVREWLKELKAGVCALAVQPDVILMDEPCSALDPIATLKIEDLMKELAKTYTIVIVTHNMQQAARVADHTAFLMMRPDRAGELVEFGDTDTLFTTPRDKRTEDYITGRFG